MAPFVQAKVEEAVAQAVNNYISTEFFKEEIKNTVYDLIPTFALDPIT